MIRPPPELTKDFFSEITDSQGNFVDTGPNLLSRKFKKEFSLGSGITLTNNEIRDAMQPFMTAGLPLTKSVLTPLAKSVLLSSVSNRCSYSKENFWIRNNTSFFQIKKSMIL